MLFSKFNSQYSIRTMSYSCTRCQHSWPSKEKSMFGIKRKFASCDNCRMKLKEIEEKRRKLEETRFALNEYNLKTEQMLAKNKLDWCKHISESTGINALDGLIESLSPPQFEAASPATDENYDKKNVKEKFEEKCQQDIIKIQAEIDDLKLRKLVAEASREIVFAKLELYKVLYPGKDQSEGGQLALIEKITALKLNTEKINSNTKQTNSITASC